MKKLIILLLVISATALSAQDYQYFTAKQGIPKALEIAKAYFQSDSVNLYSIKCVRWKAILDPYTHLDDIQIIDAINPYNDTIGKSLYWYYLICDSNDSCNYFRVWNRNGNFENDSAFSFEPPYYNKLYPLFESDIIIDTDSLVMCLPKLYADLINFSDLFVSIDGFPFQNERLPVWFYDYNDVPLSSSFEAYINTKTCEFHQSIWEVQEKNNTNSPINITSDPNTDNITIETNSELIMSAELNLYNQVGVLLFADKLNDKSYELNTYNYPSGLYLIQIKYGGNVLTKTVMVVH